MRLRQQPFAQSVKVTTEDGQGQVAFKTQLGFVATTLEAVAGLQRANR